MNLNICRSGELQDLHCEDEVTFCQKETHKTHVVFYTTARLVTSLLYRNVPQTSWKPTYLHAKV